MPLNGERTWFRQTLRIKKRNYLATITGIPQNYISRIETGCANPTLNMLERILDALHVTAHLTLTTSTVTTSPSDTPDPTPEEAGK